MDEVQIFQMNDYEWWIGACSTEQVLESYMRDRNLTREEATENEEVSPRPLESWELDILMFRDEGGQTRTFREQLAIVSYEGVIEPRVFAVEV